MTKRSRMAEKIAALRAKTTDAGCTEAEALAAAELAARLMAEHGVSEAEIGMTEASAVERTSRSAWRDQLITVIAYCTNTVCTNLIDRRYYGKVQVFIGRDPGPEIALYLRDICFRAVESELKRFKVSPFYLGRRTLKTRRQASADFVAGLVMRLQARLIELFEPLRDEAARDAARSVADIRFAGSSPVKYAHHKSRYSAAADAGWSAGGKVPLNRGVGGGASPLAIGGK